MVKEKQKNGCNLFHGRNVLPLRFLFFFSTAREQQCDSLIKHAVSWSAWKLSSMTLWPCANKSHFNKETLLAQGIKTKNPKHIRILPPFLPQKLKAWRFFTQNCSWSIYIYIFPGGFLNVDTWKLFLWAPTPPTRGGPWTWTPRKRKRYTYNRRVNLWRWHPWLQVLDTPGRVGCSDSEDSVGEVFPPVFNVKWLAGLEGAKKNEWRCIPPI